MKKINNFNVLNGVYYDRHGKPLHGVALYNAEAKHLNGGLKQTLDQNEQLKDQNEQLKKALYYSLNNKDIVMSGVLEVTDDYSRIRYYSSSDEELSAYEKFSILDTWHAVQQIYKK
ncbi:hypothetical protein [Helicobacter pylori]|uniref:hypothetical protein n=1 Tax=Helicobacter pylori TaxID=210 RepID=UPI001F1E3FBB|nr:hypothetical protein [Helicobacter pylori]